MSNAIYRTEDLALEIAVVPVVDEEVDADSRALLYRFSWPY